MSAVINRAKQHYSKALVFESLFILGFCLVVLIYNVTMAFSLLAGMSAAYLPHCLFVYLFFFHDLAKKKSKTTVLYRGEGLKWITTIMFITICFKFISNLNLTAFFSGYILILILNNLIPFVIVKEKNRKI